MTRVADVLEAVGLELAPPRVLPAPTEDEQAVLAALADGALSVDGLARATGLAVGGVAAAVCALELAGRVEVGDGEVSTTIAR